MSNHGIWNFFTFHKDMTVSSFFFLWILGSHSPLKTILKEYPFNNVWFLLCITSVFYFVWFCGVVAIIKSVILMWKPQKSINISLSLHVQRAPHTRIQGGNIVEFENIMMAAAINSQVNSGTVKITFWVTGSGSALFCLNTHCVGGGDSRRLSTFTHTM